MIFAGTGHDYVHQLVAFLLSTIPVAGVVALVVASMFESIRRNSPLTNARPALRRGPQRIAKSRQS
jgi:hypothetical protein